MEALIAVNIETKIVIKIEEIEIIKNGARIADLGGEEIAKNIREGNTELEIAISGRDRMEREIAKSFPEARYPAFQLWVDFGKILGIKKTSAQVTKHYTLDSLKGRQVAAVVNFSPKQIGKFMSEILVLGFPDETGEVVLVSIDQNVPNGGKLF